MRGLMFVVLIILLFVGLCIGFYQVLNRFTQKKDPALQKVGRVPGKLNSRWKRIKKNFEKVGIDLRINYRGKHDLFLYFLSAVSKGDQADKTYVLRVLNLYEHLEGELKRDLSEVHIEAINVTVEKIALNLQEHYQSRVENNTLQLKASLKAVETLLSQMKA